MANCESWRWRGAPGQRAQLTAAEEQEAAPTPPSDDGARPNKANKVKELRCPHADSDSARQL